MTNARIEDPERWAIVRAAFEACVDLPASERRERLATLEREDPSLAAAVAAMLEGAPGSDTLELAPDPAFRADALQAAQPDNDGLQQIGEWTLMRALGEGGMGTVFLAERGDQGVRQRAAVKVLRQGYRGIEAKRRFLAEQRMLAALHHAGIAHLIEGGISADGVPYLALEYIDGVDLLQFARQQALDAAARVRLFLEVCAAVEHAHQQLIVHRDLKPGNILVGADGHVKLLDFGIGKLLSELDDPASEQTATGMRLFTPGYGAPEQLRGGPVSTATDVYALGVVLYKLVTDRLPFEVASNSLADWERVVLTEEPTPPSRRSGALATGGLGETLWPPLGTRSWRADFDAIVMKALRREPEQRYASVAALRDDLESLLSQRPVQARRGSRRYRMAKFVRRNLLALGLVSLAVLALLAGTGVALWQAGQARAERRVAQETARRAEATVAFLTEVFANANPANTEGSEPTARDLLAAGDAELAQATDIDPATRTSLSLAMARAYWGLGDHAAELKLMQEALPHAQRSGSVQLHFDALIQLGVAYNNMEQGELAMAQYDTAERLLAASGIADPLRQARVDQLVALELNNAGRPAEALERVARAYRVLLAEHGPGSRPVVNCLDVYVLLLRLLGRQPEAVGITTPSAMAARNDPAMPSARRAEILAAHAYALSLAGRYPEAETAVRESLGLSEAVYGPEHSEQIGTLSKLMLILANQDKFAEAHAVGDRMLRIRRAHAPSPSGTLSGTLTSVAWIAIRARNWERAQTLLDESLAGLVAVGEPPAARMTRTRMLQAHVWLARGRKAEAREALEAIAPQFDQLTAEDQALARQSLEASRLPDSP